jgi:hypothetical protein
MESIRIIRRTEHHGQVREEEICIETQHHFRPGIAAPIPLAPQAESTAPIEAPPVIAEIGHTKVFADGSRAPGNDPRTDHVAVIDHTTGLMWTVESLGNPAAADKGQPQENCAQRCAELRLLGHDDWRLPTHCELSALVDVTRREPAIDTNLFPRVLPRWHWTSTPLVDSDGKASASGAWLVLFHGGDVGSFRRNGDGFALAVRRFGQ